MDADFTVWLSVQPTMTWMLVLLFGSVCVQRTMTWMLTLLFYYVFVQPTVTLVLTLLFGCLCAANRAMYADFTVWLCLCAANRDMDADFDQFDDIDDEELLSSLPLTFPFEDLHRVNGKDGHGPKVEEKEKEGISLSQTRK